MILVEIPLARIKASIETIEATPQPSEYFQGYLAALQWILHERAAFPESGRNPKEIPQDGETSHS